MTGKKKTGNIAPRATSPPDGEAGTPDAAGREKTRRETSAVSYQQSAFSLSVRAEGFLPQRRACIGIAVADS